MGVWQIIYLAWMFMGLGNALSRHGEPRKDTYNFWVSLLSSVIIVFILYKGGFFG